MTEIDRIERLKRKMVSIWGWCWTHKGDVRQQEATRIQDEQAWNQQTTDLQARLLRYTENGSPTLEELEKGPKGAELVWLAVLDRALWGHHLDLAGNREPPIVVSHECGGWMAFLRHRPLGPTVHQKQAGHIRNHLRHHHIVPTQKNGDDVRVVMPPLSLRQGLKSLVASQRPVKCYLGSFADGIQPDWRDRPDGKYTCSQLLNLDGRRGSLYHALEEARAQGADVVVLPELSLCPGLRQEVCRWLQNESHPFCMVVPGSFHERPDAHSEIPVNRTRLLDGKGHEILIHDKMLPMDTGHVHEVIMPGKCLHLLNTPLGLVALAICRDFLEEDQFYKLPWQEIAPDWAFIPSMTPIQGVGSHKKVAKSLVNCCGTRSLVPNQCPFGTYAEVNSHGFACWPDDEGKSQLCTIQPSSRLVSIPI